MSQHDMNVANQGFPNFRTDLNNALVALVSNSSGATEPTTKFAYQWWLDTSTTPTTLKIRNTANDTWITAMYLNQSTNLMTLAVGAGATGTPSYSTIGDLNTGMWFPAADTIAWSTAGSERMRINSAGSVGIGTTSSFYKLHVQSSAVASLSSFTYTPQIVTEANATGGIGMATPTANQAIIAHSTPLDATSSAIHFDGANRYMSFCTVNDTERMRIDSNGNVGIGTASPAAKFDVSGTAAAANLAVRITNTATNGYSTLHLFDGNAGLYRNGSAQTAYAGASSLNLITVGAHNIGFATNNTLRATIDSIGNLLINRTSTLGNYARLEIESASGSADLISLRQTNATAGQNVRLLVLTDSTFQISNAGYTAGVSLAYGGTSWGAISDEKLKTDLSPIQNALYKVNTLRAVTGRYKTDPEDKSRAFLIAQDVQSVLPEAVYSCMSGTNTEEKNLMLAYTDVIPLLVAALKELHEKIILLENKI